MNDRVLRALCALGEHREGAVVNARPLAEELAIELQHLFASVLVLVENDFLLYRGAGPVVEITRLGAMRCGHTPEEQGGPESST